MNEMNIRLYLYLIYFYTFSDAVFSKNDRSVLNVVILGATGSLAKKHLWKSLFMVYQQEQNKNYDFYFYGSGRREKTIGEPILIDNLKNIKCEDQHCALRKKEFVKRVQYIQLKTEVDYKQFCLQLKRGSLQKSKAESNYCPKNGCDLPENQELGRLFYIAVPPFDYNSVAVNINKYCRPEKPTWFRIAFEKPFGHDFNSMKNLSDFLLSLFHENELYRVDHYLGKKAVRDILPFRFQNQNVLDKFWTNKYIELIEIGLKEKEDVKGRIRYYDKYGVLLDVMQNHLTEILLLLTMELPVDLNSNSQIHNSKTLLLKKVRPPGSKGILLGQYKAYDLQAKQELNDSAPSRTPTFSSVVFLVDNWRWSEVPLVLTAGKDLKEKSVYVKVLFKKTLFRVLSSVSSNTHFEIYFLIHSDLLKAPAILLPKNLTDSPISAPPEWKLIHPKPGEMILGKYLTDFDVYISEFHDDAYEFIFSDLLRGRKLNFISSEHLMMSWKLWSGVLQKAKKLSLQYYSNDYLEYLDFMLNKEELRYVLELDGFKSPGKQHVFHGTFRNSNLLWGEEPDLADALASVIRQEAEKSIRLRGVFHIAFSGGSSPQQLLLALAHKNPSFPWHSTHVWMTDERCVSAGSEHSNFKLLEMNLLRFISIPYSNIHPMPVELARGLCVPEDRGVSWYETQIRSLIPHMQLDFVVLGIGSDGHVASVFSMQEPSEDSVILTVSPSATTFRMTLSLKMLNNASCIALLAFGSKKRNIIRKLKDEKSDDLSELPVMSIKPKNKVIWVFDKSTYPEFSKTVNDT